MEDTVAAIVLTERTTAKCRLMKRNCLLQYQAHPPAHHNQRWLSSLQCQVVMPLTQTTHRVHIEYPHKEPCTYQSISRWGRCHILLRYVKLVWFLPCKWCWHFMPLLSHTRWVGATFQLLGHCLSCPCHRVGVKFLQATTVKHLPCVGDWLTDLLVTVNYGYFRNLLPLVPVVGLFSPCFFLPCLSQISLHTIPQMFLSIYDLNE